MVKRILKVACPFCGHEMELEDLEAWSFLILKRTTCEQCGRKIPYEFKRRDNRMKFKRLSTGQFKRRDNRMKFKRLSTGQFKRLPIGRQFIGVDLAAANTDRTVFRRSYKAAAQVAIKDARPLPAFIYTCGNVISTKKRIAFRTNVPYSSLFCCHMCNSATIKKCQAYDWVGEGWT